MTGLSAEVIAIGDELTSGARVDTNSAWLSQRLAERGWRVVRHTTASDQLEEIESVMREAAARSSVVVSTGGLGPTADDLTRTALAAVAGVPLVRHPHIVDHIQSLFARAGRAMPESNVVQADLPAGAKPIWNASGTAPGIDICVSQGSNRCRVFCLPGVPAEMQEMWRDFVAPALDEETQSVWAFHTINCFGAGESHVESLLPGIIDRNHQPRVGITASMATISLRIAAHGFDTKDCQRQMQPTIEHIRHALGDLVYSEGDTTLADTVVALLRKRRETLAISDFFLGGDVGSSIHIADGDSSVLVGSLFVPQQRSIDVAPDDTSPWLVGAARRVASDFGASIGMAIGPPYWPDDGPTTFELAVATATSGMRQQLTHAGHPSLIHARSVKQVLNTLRLAILKDRALFPSPD